MVGLEGLLVDSHPYWEGAHDADRILRDHAFTKGFTHEQVDALLQEGSKALEGSCVPAEDLFQKMLNPFRDGPTGSVITLAKQLRFGISADVVRLLDHSVFTLFRRSGTFH